MKTLIKLIPGLVLIAGFAFSVRSQTLNLALNHESGIYKRGEKIVVTAILPNHTNDSLVVSIWKNNDQLLAKSAFIPTKDSCQIYSEVLNESCSIRILASQQERKKLIGLIVDPLRLKPGTECPKDLKKYWDQEKAALKALRMDVKSEKVDSKQPGIACFNTEINCIGPSPARGYFAKPENAKAKSLPIVLAVHAAGVKGWWCRSEIQNATDYAKRGALCFDLNAHGMLNGQPDEYYNNLEAGELKEYFFKGLENKNDLYFRGMYLRLIRTLDFLTQQPEWDGKRIIVIGESQGGGQALAAAGLDNRVSAVVATVPAMCDWGGTLVNRKGGWPQPFERPGNKENMKRVLPYFDTAHLLKFSKATIVVEIGLVDNTCPSTSIYAAINQAKGKKIIYPVTYREHTWPTDEQRSLNWDKMVFEQKNQFVENYLK
jgi:cephalosporin-C deacetylase-like acetyl esterase